MHLLHIIKTYYRIYDNRAVGRGLDQLRAFDHNNKTQILTPIKRILEYHIICIKPPTNGVITYYKNLL